jgi:hypothetical protein
LTGIEQIDRDSMRRRPCIGIAPFQVLDGSPGMTHQKIPIAVFVYNRPDHTHALLTSLAQCSGLAGCQVHIFCDGPSQPKHAKAVAATRKVIERWEAPLQAIVSHQTTNLGLARSIVSGVSQLCDDYGRVIVLEDDLILHRRFLDYMSDALMVYESHSEVFQISGFSFPLAAPTTADTYFLPLATTWGWATWRRAWQHFRWEPADAVQTLDDPIRRRRFDLDGTYPYSQMLQEALRMRVDSWGVRWQHAVFRADGIVLYPGKTLVWNAGFDDSGVHGQSGSAHWQAPLLKFQQEAHACQLRQIVPPRTDAVLFSQVKSFIARSQLAQRASYWSRLAARLRQMFGKNWVGRPRRAS